MGQILGYWRVISAVLVSVMLVVGAVYLSRGGFTPTASASTEEELLKEIAIRDLDADGLRDWEEALYGTDPLNTDSNSLGMTDGEAVSRGLIVPKAIAQVADATASPGTYVDPSLPLAPAEGTLTAEFTKEFLTLYVQAKQAKGGEALSPVETKTIADQALAALATTLVRSPDFKRVEDLNISGSGQAALLAFAAKAEAVLISNVGTARTSELPYLDRAVRGIEVEDAITQLASIAKVARETAAGIAALPVPSELAPSVLALVNALMRTSEIVSDFARVNTDPLPTMLALQQYPDVMLALGGAFIEVGAVYRNAGLTLSPEMPGAGFVNLAANIAAKQAAAATP